MAVAVVTQNLHTTYHISQLVSVRRDPIRTNWATGFVLPRVEQFLSSTLHTAQSPVVLQPLELFISQLEVAMDTDNIASVKLCGRL
jgi:hypothetical protein